MFATFKKIIKKFIKFYYRKEGTSKFIFDTSKSNIKKDILEKYGHNSDLLELFINNKNFLIHKWHHYIPIYDHYFSPFRERDIKLLEIGVSKGGSLQLWRKYFGNKATIFGIDINPECKKYGTLTEHVRIGSQIDESFLQSVIKEMGGVDIILDDGSHHMKHIPATLRFLYPHLNYDGIYMIEDLHTAYWKKYGGGYDAKNNFFKFVMDLVDDMHHWYHPNKIKQAHISKDCSSIHIHDSVVVLKKNKVHSPVHSKIV